MYSDNTWTFGIKSFEINGYGAKFQCITTDPNSRSSRSFGFASFFETKGGQTGIAFYRDGWTFASAAAGNSSVALQSLDGVNEFAPGGRVVLYGFAFQNGGFPPGVAYHEYLTVESVDYVAGVVTFTTGLQNAYDERWLDEDAVTAPPRYGKPRILPLDRDDYVFPDRVILRGFEALINPNAQIDHVTPVARSVLMEDLTASETFPQHSDGYQIDRCSFGSVTFDKFIRRAVLRDCDIERNIDDGNEVTILENCRIGFGNTNSNTIRTLSRSLILRDCQVWSSVDAEFGIIKLNEGRHGNLLSIKNTQFHNRSDKLKHVVNDIGVQNFTVEELDGNDLLFENTAVNFDLTHKRLFYGTHLWSSDGRTVGTVLNVTEDPTGKLRLHMTWRGAVPAVSDQLSYTENDRVSVSGSGVYAGAMAPMFRNPLLPNTRGQGVVVLGGDYLSWDVSTYTFFVNGILDGISIYVGENITGLTMFMEVDGVSSSIDMSALGTRSIGVGSVVELGSDVLDGSWAGKFAKSILVTVNGIQSLPVKPTVVLSCQTKQTW